MVSPVHVFFPSRVSVPVPTLPNVAPFPPKWPPSLIAPVTSLLSLFKPTLNWLDPSKKLPAPFIEAANIGLLLTVEERSTTAAALVLLRTTEDDWLSA